ncbi:substrate-binding periplasmic protein [Dethiosulfovibrio salsuginis]|uniref:Polar amino acid transport system substrate-binding protein n=1 Tax=Dethiosulfovibrio salsuginis TaxID=561720 RepID=A0A1X7JEW7_9BACT|nr:ABC transporter substrate-binding protein [Dethiosulfovibrio salsuginis]SMG26185.1 polar amino acid transport system substrate-binding protein [Dethiosulfovibrio salsuginis]
MVQHPERERDFHVSSPLVNDTQSFFHLKTFKFDWETVEDLKGTVIGATLGYSYGKVFDQGVRDGKLEIDWISTDLQNFHKLLAGRISLFPMNTLTGLDMIGKEFSPYLAKKIVYHPRPLRSEPLRLLISRATPEHKNLLDKFNQGLEELHRTGEYDEIANNYSITIDLKEVNDEKATEK